MRAPSWRCQAPPCPTHHALSPGEMLTLSAAPWQRPSTSSLFCQFRCFMEQPRKLSPGSRGSPAPSALQDQGRRAPLSCCTRSPHHPTLSISKAIKRMVRYVGGPLWTGTIITSLLLSHYYSPNYSHSYYYVIYYLIAQEAHRERGACPGLHTLKSAELGLTVSIGHRGHMLSAVSPRCFPGR